MKFEELLAQSVPKAQLKQALTEIAGYDAERRHAMLEWFDEKLAAPDLKRDECSRLLKARRMLSELDDKLNSHGEYMLRSPNE